MITERLGEVLFKLPHDEKSTLVVGDNERTHDFVRSALFRMDCCPIIMDVSGELLESVGALYRENGYKVKVLNLLDARKSHHYNPLHYIRDELGVLAFVNEFVANTSKEVKRDLLTNTEKMLLCACVFYLLDHEPDQSKVNLTGVLHLVGMSIIAKEKFDSLFQSTPVDSIARHYYKAFLYAPVETQKSAIISAVSRLQLFMIPQVQTFTDYDELELDKIGREKVALFIVTPPENTFFAPLLYSQLFDVLFDTKAQRIYPVTLFVDAGVFLPKKLSVCNKYGISAMVMAENVSQVEKVFLTNWKSIFNLVVRVGVRQGGSPQSFKIQIRGGSLWQG